MTKAAPASIRQWYEGSSVTSLGIVLGMLSGCTVPNHSGLIAENATEVREVVEGFKTALRTGDTVAALAQLDSSVRIYEEGVAETLEQYRAGHLRADMAFLQSVNIETIRENVVVGGNLAVYLSEYLVQPRTPGRATAMRGTETVILTLTEASQGERWAIRHIHWSSR